MERLAESLSYRGTVARLRATGLLRGEQIVEVFEVVGGRIHDARWASDGQAATGTRR